MDEEPLTDFDKLEPPALPQDAVYTRCYCEENVYLLCQRFSSLPEITENWLIWVVFISNLDKKVALFFQKAAMEYHLPVVWDYHVILLLQPKAPLRRTRVASPPENLIQGDAPPITARSWVYDFDSRLPVPCPWKDYLTYTFPTGLLSEYTSSFRVIPAQIYLDNFASDRSHMLVSESPRKPEGRSGDPTGQTPPVNEEAIAAQVKDVKVTPQNLVYSAAAPSYEAIFGAVAKAGGVKTNLMSHFVCMSPSPESFGEVLTRSEVAARF